MSNNFKTEEIEIKEKWMLQFLNDYILTPSKMADFAYNKLDNSSCLLTDKQRCELKALMSNDEIEKKLGWETYCNILTIRQLNYIGY
mgnify:CR=1 FL=1